MWPSLDRRRGDGAAEPQIVSHHLDVAEHVEEVAGDRDLLDRVRQLAVLDPEPGGAARVVAGHRVDAEADQLRHERPRVDRGDDRLGRMRPGGRDRSWSGATLGASPDRASGVAGRARAEPARRVGVEEVAREHAAFDDRQAARRRAPRRRTGASRGRAGAAAVVDHGDRRRGDRLAEPIRAGTTSRGRALWPGDRAREMAEQARGDVGTRRRPGPRRSSPGVRRAGGACARPRSRPIVAGVVEAGEVAVRRRTRSRAAWRRRASRPARRRGGSVDAR